MGFTLKNSTGDGGVYFCQVAVIFTLHNSKSISWALLAVARLYSQLTTVSLHMSLVLYSEFFCSNRTFHL